ncbi:hypothetical protein ACT3SP_11645 [Brachybacterium sp. AOP43-C2-M15]|uniref:hypothetical protein n=1 Tax=Brachybacterium sp. AOP43-C2-M15 TaxID=3457661 RepID=UPI0040339504
MRAISRRASTLALLVLASSALTCCSLRGGDGDRGREPEWALDEDSDRYYRPGLVVQTPDLVHEHFPTLEDPGPVTIADGQFTDPEGRELIPAQDDYWWQATVQLEPAQVEELLESAAASGASDLDGSDAPETVSEDELLAVLVPTIEGELAPCEGDWISVEPALSRDDTSGITEAGDMLELAVVCEGGDQLVISARDM